ncbi:MAG: helicase-related protein [Candidatus Pacebacteria bacterium]|nr:helicase-related protein [Candidatus Paceibacterota bacterium]
MADGNISILIGTHSVTKKSVEFKDLALIIIDEQHRFGVKTRADIAHKRNDNRLEIPHLLSMSATPIPRSLALTIFGDLDLSIIDEMPVGRKKIITKLCRQTDYDEVYDNIRSEINNGRQVYIICNKINDDEDGKKSIDSELKKIRSIFPEYNISSVHGKTEKGVRDAIMSDFKNNKINILISTTVIEVGVNVPNATIMLIENAEKFGLAQLHQIRGRVGRGDYQSYCYIFSENYSDVTVTRLNNFVKSNNGFDLAEIDLKERGPGALISYRQSGLTDIAMEGIQNIKLVEICKRLAKSLIQEDIELNNYPLLQEKLKMLSEMHLE